MAAVAAVAAFSVTGAAYAQAPVDAAQSAFGPGEQTTYRIEYLGMHAGTAQITVGAETFQWGRQVLPLVVLAKSEKMLDWYPIRDRLISYWDPASGLCVGSDFYMDENKSKRRQRIQIDHKGGKATVVRQQEGKGESTSHYDVPAGSFDMAAATFALRNLPLAVGKTFELPVFTGRRTFTLQATVEAVETVQSRIGPKEAYRVRVKTGFDGKFVAKRDLIAWMTADDAKVPVRVEAEFVLGTIRAELLDYKSGRRYALSPADGLDSSGG